MYSTPKTCLDAPKWIYSIPEFCCEKRLSDTDEKLMSAQDSLRVAAVIGSIQTAANFNKWVDGSKQIIKLFLHLTCLFFWHLATTKHNLRARHVLSDLARANYGTSVVAECNAWSAGKIPKPHSLQLCAPVTKVRKRGGRPQPPASEKPGITATVPERSQDPTLPPGEW